MEVEGNLADNKTCTITHALLFYHCKFMHFCLILFQEDESWAFQKGSPYYEVFNHQIKKMLEAGMMAKAIKQLVSYKDKSNLKHYNFLFCFSN